VTPDQAAHVTCPACDGQGSRYLRTQNGHNWQYATQTCGWCGGETQVTEYDAAEYRQMVEDNQ
jgi:DnaJ-class molecular chaperone